MSVDRRRTIALAGVAAIALAGASTAYFVRDRGTDEATVEAPAPLAVSPAASIAAAPPVVETQETVAQQPPAAEPPAEEPAVEVAQESEPEPEPVEMAAVAPSAPVETVEPAPVAQAPALPEATFDIVRVEPTGDAVIAGQAAPGATVELLRNGQTHAIEVADASGAFVFIAPPLPPGAHEIGLQIRGAEGEARLSRQSVTVVIAPGGDETPMVALAEPDRPTIVLSQPEPAAEPTAEAVAESPAEPAPAAEPTIAIAAIDPVAEAPAEAAPVEVPAMAETDPEPEPVPVAEPATREGVRIASVEAETQGGLFVSGAAAPGASVRLYLNETLVGMARAEETGSVTFAIRRGVRPGDYRVRLDDVDIRDGRVLSRAEVVFAMPLIVADEPPPPQVAAAPTAEPLPAPPAEPAPQAQIAPATESPAPSDPQMPVADAPARVETPATAEAPAEEPVERAATLTIPEINTALVARGDSLWRISRRVYGRGVRYTVIYEANAEQIRNPNLIFPGQVFVLPAAEDLGESADPATPPG
ncbi:LysM peptidoglycan-binding domain-containing protein [Salinarimonas sp.]|uniref:LysM peptidoglycan-binding domain-containing protein n=1 Tax=Salinarimonas sp. TaxID=2766526 RepID=UPI00391942D4